MGLNDMIFGGLVLYITVLPTVAYHKVTNGMGCQICNKNLVVFQFFNYLFGGAIF